MSKGMRTTGFCCMENNGSALLCHLCHLVSQIMTEAATLRFQQALPYVLLPVDPGLAALHASRARRQPESPEDPNFCSKCGHLLLGARTITKIVQRRCGTCHFVQPAIALSKVPEPGPSKPTITTTTTPTENPKIQGKTRAKNQSALQGMLSRNRDKQKEKPAAGGLAAFLEGL